MSSQFQNSSVHANGKTKVGLLIGNDISALMTANALVHSLYEAGYKPVLFMPKHGPSKKETARQWEVQNLAFYERYLLNNIVVPLVENHEIPLDREGHALHDTIYTPNQLASIYDLEKEAVADINAPEFVEKIRNDLSMPLLISIRCYQIARTDLISAQKEKVAILKGGKTKQGAIWNLHPGKLPEYQGIFSPLYAMNDLQRTFAWTLHEIIFDPIDTHKGIDKGPIITRVTKPINYLQHAISLYTKFPADAAQMVYSRVEDFMSSGGVPTTPQAEIVSAHQHQYFTHPVSEFYTQSWSTIFPRLVQISAEKGFDIDPHIRDLIKDHAQPEIVNPDEMIDFYIRSFSPSSGSPVNKALKRELRKAVTDWENNGERIVQESLNTSSPYGAVDTKILNRETFTILDKHVVNGSSLKTINSVSEQVLT